MTENLSTVESTATIFSRSQDLPSPIRLIDGVLQRIVGGYPSFYMVARRHDARLLHAHMGPMGYGSLTLAKRLDIPLITSFYGKDASQLPIKESSWRKRYQELFEEGDLFLAEGPHMKEQLENLGCPAEKVKVHRIGIDTDRYQYRPRHRKRGKPLRVLMVGRFVEKKGFVDGVKAFARFVEKGGEGVLNVVGDSDGSESSEKVKVEVSQTIEDQGLAERVNLHGFLAPDELREQYYDNHVLLVPSCRASTGDNEGGAPVTIIEAQSTGLPVIGTDHCDIPNLVEVGETGFIVEEGNVAELSEAMLSISTSKGAIEHLGRGARSF
ncbi:glycosyltransferase, partial [Salinibacter altiplanensis]|uniref:glycosyltransferase n=1 Tax=Salinibacter altiplanensis TaxID=1803181 RepID=UPI00131A5926